MTGDIVVEPMTEKFLLWRCLHKGPLSHQTIDRWPADNRMAWERYRKRNIPLLAKLTQTYGACAIVARDEARIVGHLRFYPKAVWDLAGSPGLCLQQDYPSGPGDDLAGRDFPPLAEIRDKTLLVHCLMTGGAQQRDNPYRRKGIGTRMVITFIEWAKVNGWDRIEANSFEDILLIYENTGCAGHTFWEKLGFAIVDRHPHPDLRDDSQFVRTLEEQAKSMGIRPEKAKDQITMRLSLA